MTIWLILAFLVFGVFSVFIGIKIASRFQLFYILDLLDRKPGISLKEFKQILEDGGEFQD